MLVQTLGYGRGLLRFGSSMCSFVSCSLELEMSADRGRRLCHWPNSLAMARDTFAVRISSALHVVPGTKRYSNPFSNRAINCGAKPG